MTDRSVFVRLAVVHPSVFIQVCLTGMVNAPPEVNQRSAVYISPWLYDGAADGVIKALNPSDFSGAFPHRAASFMLLVKCCQTSNERNQNFVTKVMKCKKFES